MVTKYLNQQTTVPQSILSHNLAAELCRVSALMGKKEGDLVVALAVDYSS
jgi:hypothetical protein